LALTMLFNFVQVLVFMEYKLKAEDRSSAT